MDILSLYRGGYERGFKHAQAGSRKLADIELLASTPLAWLPLVDKRSYFQGYDNGYRDGIAARHILPRAP